MFKPKVNTTSEVCIDTKTHPSMKTVRNEENVRSENKTSTDKDCSSRTNVKYSGVNTTSKVYINVKTQQKLKTVRNENKTSTGSECSSSTNVKPTVVAVHNCVDVNKFDFISLNTAGSPCPALQNQNQDFTSNEQLSESDFGPNDQ